MQVIKVEEHDIINSLPNNALIFHVPTQTYFKKDPSVILNGDVTFRDAIFGPYKSYTRYGEREIQNDFIKYYDSKDEEKVLNAFGEIDKINALRENRRISLNSTTILNTLSSTIKSSFENNKTNISSDYLTKFDKIIYVDQTNGNDMNDGLINTPLKTIRKAESYIINNTAIVIAAGVYDITRGNTKSNQRYCISGLSGDKTGSNYVEYINQNNIGDVVMVVDTEGLDFEARDITFINKMVNAKIYGITFKMNDHNKKTSYSATIIRESENVVLIDCIFDLNVVNGNITYNMVSRDSVVFQNCIIDLKKELTGPEFDKPYMGRYELDGCFINQNIQNKLLDYDLQSKNEVGEITLINNLNTTFF